MENYLMKLKLLLLIILLAPMSSMANDQCSDILRQGIFDEDFDSYRQSLDYSFIRMACEDLRTSNNSDTNIITGYGSLLSSSDRQKARKACENITENLSWNSSDVSFLRTTSKAIVSAWSSCMSSASGPQVRFSLKQIKGNTYKKIRGFLRVNPGTPENPTPATVKVSLGVPTDLVDNCAVVAGGSGALKDGNFELKVERGKLIQFSCDRKTLGEITIAGKLENFNGISILAQLPQISTFPTVGTSARLSFTPVKGCSGVFNKPSDIELLISDMSANERILLRTVGRETISISKKISDITPSYKIPNLEVWGTRGTLDWGFWAKRSNDADIDNKGVQLIRGSRRRGCDNWRVKSLIKEVNIIPIIVGTVPSFD